MQSASSLLPGPACLAVQLNNSWDKYLDSQSLHVSWLIIKTNACLLRLQFLDSYKSVTLQSMAESFGVSVDFIDGELADFIVSGRLTAKIDKVAGVVETNRSDAFCFWCHTVKYVCLHAHSCEAIRSWQTYA